MLSVFQFSDEYSLVSLCPIFLFWCGLPPFPSFICLVSSKISVLIFLLLRCVNFQPSIPQGAASRGLFFPLGLPPWLYKKIIMMSSFSFSIHVRSCLTLPDSTMHCVLKSFGVQRSHLRQDLRRSFGDFHGYFYDLGGRLTFLCAAIIK